MVKEPKTMIVGLITTLGAIIYTQFNVMFEDYFKDIKSYIFPDVNITKSH
jgi:hypothetical protein